MNSPNFIATSENQNPIFFNHFNHSDFPVAHFNYLTFDNHSFDESLDLHPPVRQYANHIPQIPSFDTTSSTFIIYENETIFPLAPHPYFISRFISNFLHSPSLPKY